MKTAFAFVLTLIAAPAFAEPLAKDAHVTKMLVGAQVGDILRNTCPQVSARMFVVMGELVALERHAKSKGHDDATIRAFLDSPTEKARIRKLADAYLANAGVKAGNVDSYCAAARAEVAAATVAGSLIRVRR